MDFKMAIAENFSSSDELLAQNPLPFPLSFILQFAKYKKEPTVSPISHNIPPSVEEMIPSLLRVWQKVEIEAEQELNSMDTYEKERLLTTDVDSKLLEIEINLFQCIQDEHTKVSDKVVDDLTAVLNSDLNVKEKKFILEYSSLMDYFVRALRNWMYGFLAMIFSSYVLGNVEKKRAGFLCFHSVGNILQHTNIHSMIEAKLRDLKEKINSMFSDFQTILGDHMDFPGVSDCFLKFLQGLVEVGKKLIINAEKQINPE